MDQTRARLRVSDVLRKQFSAYLEGRIIRTRKFLNAFGRLEDKGTNILPFSSQVRLTSDGIGRKYFAYSVTWTPTGGFVIDDVNFRLPGIKFEVLIKKADIIARFKKDIVVAAGANPEIARFVDVNPEVIGNTG